ncbi:restriction endonuclease subunit S [Brevibacillus porteri]|uniref:restriction endonuclease subunit S n=1 Tax=Brevibacillus porteri TaxID=2126350 RepID=UPI0036449A15
MSFNVLDESWDIKTIGDLVYAGEADIQTGPFGTMLQASSYSPNGTPVIAVKDIGMNKIIHGKSPLINDSDAERLSRYKLQQGDIIFGRKGAVDRRALVTVKEEGWIQGSDCIRIRFTTPKIDPVFVSYFLGTKFYINWIISNAQGTTMPSLNQEILKRVTLPIPSIEEQRRISSVLKATDEKIELNNAINKNLEEIAQALFKRWFVDFEFLNENGEPYKSSGGEFEESELGLIPKGWKIGTIDDLCETIFSGGTPSTRNASFWDGDYYWLSSGETRNSYIITTEKTITKDGIENSSTRLAKKYDIVIASAGQGSTRGQTSICLMDTYINQSIIALRANQKTTFPSYLFFNLKNRYEELRQISDSNSIRGSLTTNMLKKYKVIIPPFDIQNQICPVLSSFINSAEHYVRQNKSLSELRDNLLPKLMSGEIRVPLEKEYELTTDLPMAAESKEQYFTT